VGSIPYKNDWGVLAAKISTVTHMFEETTLYILQQVQKGAEKPKSSIKSAPWLQV
jgi:hypothetical protein